MSLPRPTRRLALGFALSGAIHLAIMLAFGPGADRHISRAPLTVEIRRETASTIADESAAVPPVEVAAKPVIAPSLDQPVFPETPKVAAEARDAPAETRAPLDKYFALSEVDVRPKPINEVELVYPSRAYVMRTKGRVVLRIFINEDGIVDDVSVLEGTPPGVFEEAAITAALALEFRPAMKRGHPVKAQNTIEVVFDPYESINVP